MTISNLQDIAAIGSATMANGDFLTYDALANNKFSLVIPRLPNCQFFLQTFNLPEVAITQVPLPTRIVDYNCIGEKMKFSNISFTFLVDKYCRNWAEVYNWMKAITVEGSAVDQSTNAVLMINNEPTIRFYGSWPTSLTGFSFDATVDGVIYVKSTLEMNLDYFDYIGKFSTIDSEYGSQDNI